MTFENLGSDNAGGVEPVVLESDVTILNEDIAAVRLSGVGLDGAEGGVGSLDADEVQIPDDGSWAAPYPCRSKYCDQGDMLMMPLAGPSETMLRKVMSS